MQKINFTYKNIKIAEIHFDESLQIKQISDSAIEVKGCCKKCIDFFMQGMVKVLPEIKTYRPNDTIGKIFFPGVVTMCGRALEIWEEGYEFSWTKVES